MLKEIVLQQADMRLDKALTEALPEDFSRSQVQALMRDGKVSCAGRKVKASDKSFPGMRLLLEMPEPEDTTLKVEAIALDIVYEDEYLMVINKPQGMVVHPGAGHRSGTLVNALLHHSGDNLSDINTAERPGIVHRLDKDTSGLLLVAKDNKTHRRLAKALAVHKIERIYECIVYGFFSEKAGLIDAPIARDKQNRQRMACQAEGKEARTHFRLLASLKYGSYLRVRLETGRTHQIRVHMRYIGHPVLADPLYAPNRETFGLKGQCLHARKLSFTHPMSGERMHFEAPLPAWFEETLNKLGYPYAEHLTWPDEWPDEVE